MSEEPTGGAAPPFATRYGLVRPLQGRYLAGVCAALGRATRTDPVLWRVVLAVLVCFMGIGAVLYLVAWLLIPEEGDTGSPLEAVLGRGRSSTSPVLIALLGLVVAFLLVLILPRPLYLVLGGATALAALLLISRSGAGYRPAGAPAAAPTTPTAPPAPPPAAPAAPPGFADGAPAGPTPGPAPPAAAGPGADPASSSLAPPAAAPDPPPVSAPTSPGLGIDVATGYRPPFAPHGPFAGLGPPAPPPPPRRTRERSSLPALIFFTSLVVFGVLGMLDLTGVLSIPAAGYLAAALAVIGAGLVTGAWLGRARPLIALGVVLALALPAVHALGSWDAPENVGDLTWIPQDQAELADEYALSFGSGTLDLRQVDFAGREREITVRISFGEMEVRLPPDVAVEATVRSQLGGATVLGHSRDGVSEGTVHDPGSGDPADGTLRLDLHVSFGDMDVHR